MTEAKRALITGITGPTQREEILRERKIKRFLKFIKQNYTERRKTERERKGNYITSPAALQHREKKFFF